MFAELAAITSAISAINQTISTFKEGRANAQQAAALLGKFGTTAQKLDDWEKKKKLNISILSSYSNYRQTQLLERYDIVEFELANKKNTNKKGS